MVVPNEVRQVLAGCHSSATPVIPFGGNPPDWQLRLVGVEQIRATIRFISQNIANSADSVIPVAPTYAALKDSLRSDVEVPTRGIRLRSFFPAGVQQLPHIAKYAEFVARGRAEVRCGESGPVRFIVADRSVALVATATSSATEALVTTTEGLVSSFQSQFELMWRQAAVIKTSRADQGLTPREVEVLRALLTCATEAAIAHNLQRSLRTVQRAAHRLRQHFGAVSKVDLVAKATEQGWRSTPLPPSITSGGGNPPLRPGTAKLRRFQRFEKR